MRHQEDKGGTTRHQEALSYNSGSTSACVPAGLVLQVTFIFEACEEIVRKGGAG